MIYRICGLWLAFCACICVQVEHAATKAALLDQELQNRALSAGIPSESVRVALNAEDPHQKLLNLLLKQLQRRQSEMKALDLGS